MFRAAREAENVNCDIKWTLKLQSSSLPENSQREEVELGRALGSSNLNGDDRDVGSLHFASEVHSPEQAGRLTTTSQKRKERKRRRKTKKTTPTPQHQHQQQADEDARAPSRASSSQTSSMERGSAGLLDPNATQEGPVADTCKVFSAFLCNAQCVLCSVRCPCIFYDTVSDTIRRMG